MVPMTAKRWLVAALVVAFVASCDSTPRGISNSPAAQPPGAVGKTHTVNLDDRPFQLHVPSSYDAAAKTPLVVLLHGYTSSAAQQEGYFKLTAESERRGFLYAMPDGTQDRQGRRFWNATAACCDFAGSGVDDSAYLSKLLDTVKASYSVDPGRVYFVGHSNGGFMAYRMACEHSDQITAIVSLAGAAASDAASCAPKAAVSVLQIHGTADRTILFDGGANAGRPYPSVAATLESWRGHNGCAAQVDTSTAPIDLDSRLPGPETAVTAYRADCRDATQVQLWSIQDGGHIPALTPEFPRAVTDFLLAQVSPS
jgi:polyhydroxybutyrate depolymerase